MEIIFILAEKFAFSDAHTVVEVGQQIGFWTEANQGFIEDSVHYFAALLHIFYIVFAVGALLEAGPAQNLVLAVDADMGDIVIVMEDAWERRIKRSHFLNVVTWAQALLHGGRTSLKSLHSVR